MLKLEALSAAILMSNNLEKHNANPDVRPSAQNIKLEKGSFATTPPIPRPFKSSFTPEILKAYHAGVMNYTYRGLPCLKSPIDLAIYMLIIWELKPATIVEIGSFQGGAAKFYKDITQAYGMDTQVITVDFRESQYRGGEEDSQIEFVLADALELEKSQLHTRLDSAPRPWLVIEDSAHTFSVSYAVMEYFMKRLLPGEMLIIEDGIIEDQGGNWRYDGGPNRAVCEFFQKFPDIYELSERHNDFFGRNLSYNPNGYLVRTDKRQVNS